MRSVVCKAVLGGLIPAVTIAVLAAGIFLPKDMTTTEAYGAVGGGGCCQLKADDCKGVQNNIQCGRHWTCPSGDVGNECINSGSSPCSTTGGCSIFVQPNNITCNGSC